ncbi:proline dehydrogenase family protein [Williamsia sterculiae]|uniref:proline dehydrogenase n=1 Tax=Williamsia sterculiae TaxID=1344003 RepID=A0A1N7DHF4_9NOCA|nr:proline dehydrogenase family protein [Williamsia sterculiae]SIR75185.1 L-proline dehydrogenase [Williamsia sterculiae]
MGFFDTALRPGILAAGRSDRLKVASSRTSMTRNVVERFVPGETEADVLAATEKLLGQGLMVSIDHLGEDTTDERQATATTEAYHHLIGALGTLGAAPNSLEVSLKLSALGQALPRHGTKIATENAMAICDDAQRHGVLVTVDAEDHASTAERLDIVRTVRTDFPTLGTVLQAYLRRTEDDCTEFSGPGSRIRLCKGAYAESPAVAFTDRAAVDEAYQRCLRILMCGSGYPMIASHDPVMIESARVLATETRRLPDSWEHQMLYGIRTDEQRRLAEAGGAVRVYLPFGAEWYGYFVRRLAERPANLTFFARALVGR